MLLNASYMAITFNKLCEIITCFMFNNNYIYSAFIISNIDILLIVQINLTIHKYSIIDVKTINTMKFKLKNSKLDNYWEGEIKNRALSRF